MSRIILSHGGCNRAANIQIPRPCDKLSADFSRPTFNGSQPESVGRKLCSTGAVALGVVAGCAAYGRQHGRLRHRQTWRKAVGSVESRRFLRGWTDPPSSSGTSHAADIRFTHLSKGTLQLQVVEPASKFLFGEEFAQGRGTTENVYLLFGAQPEKQADTCLIDLPDEQFAEALFQGLAAAHPCQVSALVLTFFDNRRCRSLEVLAGLPRPNRLRVHCGNSAAAAIAKLMKEKPALETLIDLQPILRSGTVQYLGGRRLRLVLASTPKFPEALCVFDAASSVFFTGKLFSSHCAVDQAFDDAAGGFASLGPDWQHVFDVYFLTHRIRKVLNTLKGFMPRSSRSELRAFLLGQSSERGTLAGSLEAKMLAPCHGAVVRGCVEELFQAYEGWAQERFSGVWLQAPGLLCRKPLCFTL